MLSLSFPPLYFWTGGAAGSPLDKVFVSAGAEVRGFSKKGKQFLKFDNNLTEPIKTM